MKTIKKAVISCAGFGTRFLPLSKTIQKEMLPIINRPVIDYIIKDCKKAGINEFVIVINEHNYQPLHYYRENLRLAEYLKQMDKFHLYEQVKDLHQGANFSFVKQTDSDPYGTSIPVLLAKNEIVNEEAFLYLTGDDFVFFADESRSFIDELIAEYHQSEAEAALCSIQVAAEVTSQYGIISMKRDGNFNFLKSLIEKPDSGKAPSSLANISKYILTPSILPIIETQKINAKSGEYYITDALEMFAQTKKVLVHQTKGKYLNAGDPTNWLKANLTVAGSNPELKKQLVSFIKQEWNI